MMAWHAMSDMVTTVMMMMMMTMMMIMPFFGIASRKHVLLTVTFVFVSVQSEFVGVLTVCC